MYSNNGMLGDYGAEDLECFDKEDLMCITTIVEEEEEGNASSSRLRDDDCDNVIVWKLVEEGNPMLDKVVVPKYNEVVKDFKRKQRLGGFKGSILKVRSDSSLIVKEEIQQLDGPRLKLKDNMLEVKVLGESASVKLPQLTRFGLSDSSKNWKSLPRERPIQEQFRPSSSTSLPIRWKPAETNQKMPRADCIRTRSAATMGTSQGNKSKLKAMFVMTAVFFLVEIITGYWTNSMALVADSFHMLSDVAALIVAFVSVKMSPKKWSKNTFGWARAEVLGALVNAVFLVALCFSILVESVKRFIHMEKIDDPEYILGVGIIGLLVNLIGLCIFRHHHGGGGHSHHHHSITNQSRLTRLVATDDNENDERVTSPDNAPPDGKTSASASQMNMRGVFLHLMADALGSVIVIVSALVILLTEWEWRMYIDPFLSVVMVFIIFSSVWPLLMESGMILLQTVPTHIQIDDLQQKLVRDVEGVIAVHEFHIWQLAGDRIIASAHIRCRNLTDYIRIAEKVKVFFHNEGIHSTTIQPEFVEHYPEALNINNSDCFLACPEAAPATGTGCAANTCCGLQRVGNSDVDIPGEGDLLIVGSNSC